MSAAQHATTMGLLAGCASGADAPRCSAVLRRRRHRSTQETTADAEILAVLDDCTRGFTFPMLDNGYVYLAATRMAAYRAAGEWGLVIEVFGYSPRAGVPDLHIHTFASELRDRNPESEYVSRAAYDNYLRHHPHDDHRFFYPVDGHDWVHEEDVADGADEVVVRGSAIKVPKAAELEAYGIHPQSPPRVAVFELCRYLAETHRDLVLASPDERRVSVRSGFEELLVLDEWHHADVLTGALPSESEAFKQLAVVLATGDVDLYRPTATPNTHWRNWPDGGQL